MTGNCVRHACKHTNPKISPDEATAALRTINAPATRSDVFRAVLAARGCNHPDISARQAPAGHTDALDLLVTAGTAVQATTPAEYSLTFGPISAAQAPLEPVWMSADGARAHLETHQDRDGYAALVARELNRLLASMGLTPTARAQGAAVALTLPAPDMRALTTRGRA